MFRDKGKFYIDCSKECRGRAVVLDLTKVIKFDLKRSMLHVLALGLIMKVKCFPSSPSRVCESTEKELYALGFFLANPIPVIL